MDGPLLCAFQYRPFPDLASGLPEKPRSNFSDGVYPKNLDVVGARSAQAFARYAQAFAKLARTETVRADRRLRTDDNAIRAQSTILG
jgi:hypothetical protein